MKSLSTFPKIKSDTMMFGGLGLCFVLLAWLIPQPVLADFFTHPTRSHALEHALHSAAAARIGWSIIGLSFCIFPYVFQLLAASAGAQTFAADSRLPSVAPPFSFALFILISMSIIVRLIRVNESLWYDEIAALATYVMHGPGVIMGNAFTTANHPLQSLLSWICLPLSIEPGIRIPSILAGALAVYATWCFTRQVLEERIALVAAAAMAFAPAAVLASAEARGYALAIALGALATSMMLSMLRQRHHRLTPIYYALVMSLATWAHFVVACLAAGHVLMALWTLHVRRQRASFSPIFAVIFAAFLSLGLWSPALPDLLHSRAQFLALTGNEPSLLGPEGGALLEQLAGAYGWPALPSALLLIVGLIGALREKNLRLALMVAALGVPLAILGAWIANSWLYARFLLFALPATAFLIAVGFQIFWRWRRAIALPITGISLALWITDIVTRIPKQPLREAIAFVASNKSSDDTVLTITPADNVGEWYALSNQFQLLPTGQNGSQLAEKLRFTQPPPNWIVVLYPAAVTDSAIELMRVENFKMVGSFPGWVDWGRGTIHILKRIPPAQISR